MFNFLKRKSNSISSSRRWLNGDALYEGLPIYFRRLDIRPSEYIGLSSQYPVRVAITQYLRHVKDNGLPESEYNKSLFDFDAGIISLFHEQGVGITFLVETFAAKRTYYFYARSKYEDSQLRAFQERFPEENINWVIESDPSWTLPKMYAADFSFK